MYYTKEQLLEAGFESVGENCRISAKTSLYSVSGILGKNVRIDDFCILKGRIHLGDYIHIGAFCLLTGVAGEIRLDNCSVLSSGVHVYTGSDDYRADVLSSSVVPQKFVKTITGNVTLGKGVVVGAQSLLLPKTTIEDGASVGAHCVIYGRIAAGAVISAGSIGDTQVVRTRDFRKILSFAEEVCR